MGSGLGWSAVDRWVRHHGGVVDACFALAVAVLLLPVSLRTVWSTSWPRSLAAAVVVALVLGHAGLAARRSAPRLAYGVAGALVLLLVLVPELDPGGRTPPFSAVLLPSVLVFPIALYSVAAWCSHRTSMLALAASAAGGAAVVARLWSADYLTVAQPGVASAQDPVESWPLFLLLGALAMVAAPWCAGRYRRLRALYVAALEERARHEHEARVAEARRAAEDERRRIAREMHDVVAHSLAVMVSQAEGGRLMAARDPAATAPVLDNIARAGREAMQDMRGVLRVLDGDDRGPAGVEPRPALADLPGLVATARRSGLPVHLDEQGPRQPMSAAAELAAYRVTQEALTNVLKHAGLDAATQVHLRWRPDALELTVSNSTGPRRRATPGSGRGLPGMDERLAALGGDLRVTDRDDRFSVVAHLPTTREVAGRP
ncbi:sensor histidine kinase [Nocardioides halotolerans]|uniref:sensor histidine kinase n=1 Tax=Nocardioides halotolerans TaxID=433660 RepID=UPI0003F5CE4B|nr:histidine kinase [Nocardioides halotolerans]